MTNSGCHQYHPLIDLVQMDSLLSSSFLRQQSLHTPELRQNQTKPKTKYMFGYPDMQEILRNIQANDDRNDVAVFEDVQTPVNEPPPQFQDGFYDKAAVDRVEWV